MVSGLRVRIICVTWWSYGDSNPWPLACHESLAHSALSLRVLAAGPVCGYSGRAGRRSMSAHAASQGVLTTTRSLLTWAGTAGQSVKSP